MSVFSTIFSNPLFTQNTGAQAPKANNAHITKSTASFSEAMSAAEKFMQYQEMTPAEKFRAAYLAEKGLTEEDVAQMSAEDRAKLEEEIAARIREKLAQSFTARTGT